jgi:acyl-CoA reductase-like NAD-dependent aldehyde dehydrogenase
MDECEFPAGVFNLVTGPGRTIGETMCTHPDVDMVSLTGSTEAGQRVGQLAAQSVKRVGLELGGKSASVILDDADVAKAAGAAGGGICLNSGQVCAALSRLIVPRAMQDEAVAAAKAAVEAAKVGGAFEEGVTMGPVASKAQLDTVKEYIQTGIDEGATLVTEEQHLQKAVTPVTLSSRRFSLMSKMIWSLLRKKSLVQCLLLFHTTLNKMPST